MKGRASKIELLKAFTLAMLALASVLRALADLVTLLNL